MGRWSKKQSHVTRSETGQAESFASQTRDERKRRGLKLAAFALMGVFGLGAGWVAGKALGIALRPPVSSSSTSANETAAPPQPQPEVKQQPPVQPPISQTEPKPVPKENKDSRDVEPPDDRHPVEKLGRRALKKILKEIEKEVDPDKPRGKRKDKENQ